MKTTDSIYIQKRVDKYENVTYVIMTRTPCDGGFVVDEFNGEIYTDLGRAESKLNFIKAINE